MPQDAHALWCELWCLSFRVFGFDVTADETLFGEFSDILEQHGPARAVNFFLDESARMAAEYGDCDTEIAAANAWLNASEV
jgi:hypothetical protein